MREIRIGCYGTNGHQILGLAPALKGASIDAVAGVSEAEFDRITKDHPNLAGSLKHYPDLEALLADDRLAMVSLCSPRRDRQAEETVRALEAGKHVLAEKPLCLTLEELQRIRGAEARTDRELRAMTGSIYESTWTAMKEVVDSGEIGEPVQVSAQKSYPFHDRRPQDRGVDGGLIRQAGIHAVTFIRWATGREFAAVSAFDTTCGNPRDGQLQMAAGLAFTLDNGGTGAANLNYLNPRQIGSWGDDRLRVYGTEGMVENLRGATRLQVTTNRKGTREIEAPAESPGRLEQAFIDLILHGTPMRASAGDCLLETEVVCAAQLSADRGGEPMRIGVGG